MIVGAGRGSATWIAAEALTWASPAITTASPARLQYDVMTPHTPTLVDKGL